jgi:5-methylcytosine-specific restriction endonuclease McrBC regulatory subunit McrC
MNQLEQKELISLREYSEGAEVTSKFSSQELEILASEFKGKVEVIFTLKGIKLKATEHVGTIILPNHIISIRPKISDANFMSMIIFALRLPEIGLGTLPALANLDFYHIIIRFLINYLDGLLRRGVYKGYITKSENVNYVKGKIAFKHHLLHNQGRNDKIFCSFSEITADTLENRIIKFTLFYLLQFIIIDNITRLEILRIYKKFHMVGDLKSVSRNIFGSIIYTPLNEHYRTILSLCELILRDSSLDIEERGQMSSLSFLVNMDTLFQEFIAGILITKFGEGKIDLQKTRYFDTHKELSEISDIELSSGKTSIILDIKYKDTDETIPPAEHVRQVFCYSRITGSKKCVLVYASNKHVITKKYYLPDDICLFQLHFKLPSSSKEEFDQNCFDFMNEIDDILKA